MADISKIGTQSNRIPSHLSTPATRFYKATCEDFILEAHHCLLLEQCLVAWDRAQNARRVISKYGPFINDRYGRPIPHPAVKMESDARESFARLLRQLDLEGEPDASRRRR